MRPLKRWIIFSLLFLCVSTGIILAYGCIAFGQKIQLNPPPTAIPASLFGMHIHFAVKKHPDLPTNAPWPAVPFGSLRLWDALVNWPLLEPEKGKWNFETLDKTVALAEKNRVELLMTLGQSPRWASARPNDPSPYAPGWSAEPKNIEDWRNYVRTLATRYKGRIRYYEIWNEPNWKRFYTGSLEEMLILSREAYRILKQVDPAIVVVSPSATDGDEGVSWLKKYLDKGGGNFIDAIGFHFYVVPQLPEATVPLIEKVRQVMVQHGLSNKLLWNTEAGWSNPKPFPSDELAAAYVARAYILNWAAGVSRFYWYAWDDLGVSLTMIEPDIRTLKPAAIAYAQVQKWLVGARMNHCTQNQSTWICQLSRQGGYNAWIVWNSARKSGFQVPASWGIHRVRDLTGNQRNLSGTTTRNNPISIEIGSSPLLLERLTQ